MILSNHYQTRRLSRLLVPSGTKLMFGLLANSSAIILAASSLLISIWAEPYFITALLMSLAESASAYDLMIWANLSYSSRATMDFCLSASCCWTAFCSIACEYSLLKPRCINDTSSTATLNSLAFCVNVVLISLLISSRNFKSWSASSESHLLLHWATTVLRTYWPIEKKIFLSYSLPKSWWICGRN